MSQSGNRDVFLQIWLILLGIFMLIQSAHAGNFIFEQISMQEGLSQTTVRSILRDQLGLLWIGTKNGLNRYDGKEMRNYFHRAGKPSSLPDNYIYFINEDPARNIWVGTGKGVVRYDRPTDSFLRVYPDGANRETLYSNSLVMGSSVLFGAVTKVVVYNSLSRQFRTINFKGDVRRLPPAYNMVPWKGNSVLIASRWRGLFILDLDTGLLKKADFLDDQEIMTVFLDSFKRLWVSVYQKGVKLVGWDESLIAHYHSDNSALSNNIVLTINEVDEQIWMGTDGGGINIFSPQTDVFSCIENIPEDRNSLPVSSVSLIYKDELAGVWFGTIRGGVFGVKQVNISSYSDVSLNNPYGLSSQTVLSIFQDADDVLWLGTDGGGINRYNPETGLFRHFPHTFKKKVNAISRYSPEKLLVCCFGEGLKLFNKKSGKIEELLLPENVKKQLPGQGFVGVGLKYLAGDSILIFDDRIHLFNPERQEIRLMTSRGIKAGGGELKMANDYYNDDLILFNFNGIYSYNYLKNEIDRLYVAPEINKIFSVCRDKNNNIWVGTTLGLFLLNTDTSILEPVKSDFLYEVPMLVSDDDGQLWLGSGGDLYCYYPVLQVFRFFGRSDGVMVNEYLTKAVWRCAKGDIYLGGVMGLVRVRKDLIVEKTLMPSLKIVEFLEDGVLISKDKFNEFQTFKKITLPCDYKSFQVKVIVKDLDFFDQNHYKYKVVGYSKQFIETSSMQIDFSNLPPGDFMVITMTRDEYGNWSKPVEQFLIVVLPPWWRTWWFISLVLLVLGASVVFIRYSSYKRGLNKSRLEMVERERMLNEQKVRFLINISHELRTPLSLIYDPLERLIKGEVQEGQQQNLLLLMNRQVRYIKKLIDQLLNIHRIERLGHQLHFSPLEFNKWMEERVKEFDFEFASRGILLDLKLDKNIDQVEIDADACKNVVDNLLMNVLKYAPESSKVIVSASMIAEQRVRVAVQDQGKGISAGDEERLFERFYQADHNKGGIGVGLAFSRSLIEAHHGQMGAYNVSAGGAVFYFEIPIKQSAGHEKILRRDVETEIVAGKADVPEVQKLAFLKGLSVLVVEDDVELSNYLKSNLKEQFKKVFVARDGKQALGVLRREWPDLVVSDVMMPEMDGFELCSQLKSDLEISHIPVILLTARQDEEGIRTGYKMGADAYLTKPFSIEVLTDLIYNLSMGRMRMKEKIIQTHGVTIKVKDLTYSNADEKFLERLNELISEQISNPDLGVDMLAEQLAMSRASLYAKFKALLDIGVNAYINDLRIREAMRLLVSTDLSVADISVRVGMTSQSYFSTLFKQVAGKSPLKYRQDAAKVKE